MTTMVMASSWILGNAGGTSCVIKFSHNVNGMWHMMCTIVHFHICFMASVDGTIHMSLHVWAWVLLREAICSRVCDLAEKNWLQHMLALTLDCNNACCSLFDSTTLAWSCKSMVLVVPGQFGDLVLHVSIQKAVATQLMARWEKRNAISVPPQLTLLQAPDPAPKYWRWHNPEEAISGKTKCC